MSALEGREKQLRLVFQQQQSGAKQKRSTDDQRKRLLDSAIIDVGTDDSWTNREDEPLLASGANSSDNNELMLGNPSSGFGVGSSSSQSY